MLAPAHAERPRFHCYTYPNSTVAAYQSPVKCADGSEMEIVCTYSAGCMPTKEKGEPPEKSAQDLIVMFTSQQLKGSFLLCKGQGKIENGQMKDVKCPTATQCQSDGLFAGVPATVQMGTEREAAPQTPGGANVTR